MAAAAATRPSRRKLPAGVLPPVALAAMVALALLLNGREEHKIRKVIHNM